MELHYAVHPHERGDNATIIDTPTRDNWFTPTSVGTTRYACTQAGAECGSPPRAWGQRVNSTPNNNEATVHPHERGDNGHQSAKRGDNNWFTPTSVGTTVVSEV